MKDEEKPEKKKKGKPLVPAAKRSDEDPSKIENEGAIVDAVDNLYEEASRARYGREQMWMDCLAFEQGNQSRQWVWRGNQYVDSTKRMAPWRSRYCENAIKPAVDQVTAITADPPPSLIAAPATSDFEDESRGEIGTAILESQRQALDFKFWDSLIKRHKGITGTAGLELEWDTAGGIFQPVLEDKIEMQLNPETGLEEPVSMGPEPKLDEDGKVVMEPSGKFEFTFHSTLELYLDPSSPFYHRWRYLITATIASRVELERQYGIKLPDEDGDSGQPRTTSTYDGGTPSSRTALLLQQAAALYGGTASEQGAGFSFDRKGVTVIRCHLAPSAENPAGRLIVIAESKVLYDDVSPARGYFRFPVAIFYHKFNGMSPYGDGYVNGLIDPQRSLNKTMRQMEENRELMLRPKWMVPRQCNINKDAITSQPAEVVQYDCQTPMSNTTVPPPTQVSPVPIPESLFSLRNSFYEAIDRISGIHDAQRGQVPTGVKTGRGLQVLNQQTAIRLSEVRKQDYLVWRDVGKYLLWLTSQWWSDGQIIQYVGRNLEPEVAAYKSAMFDEPVDVFVENDEGLPQDPADRGAVLSGLFAKGGIMEGPPEMKKAFFRLSKYSDVRRLVDLENADAQNARRKYMLCLENEPQFADRWEDHATCIRTLVYYMKQKDFYDLPEITRGLVIQLEESYHAFLQGTPPPGAMNGGQAGGGVMATPEALQAAAERPPEAPSGSAPRPPSNSNGI